MHIPELTEWTRRSTENKTAVAHALAAELPTGFRFREIRSFSMGALTHEVALFTGSGTDFVLLPGGQITLGFDARRWQPSAEETESWQGTAEEYEIETSISEHVEAATLPQRQVEIAPFLIETRAAEIGWRPIDLKSSEARGLVRHLPKGRAPFKVSMSHAGREVRVTRDPSGRLKAQIAQRLTHESIRAEVAADGFRLPTSDEWEYACGAGGDTLFRWGDHVPSDRYPTEKCPVELYPEEMSGEPALRFAPDWEDHRRPNAFGLRIAEDPYKSELLAEPGMTRGGDGGCMICGGAGFFAGWLPLATAYFEPHACEAEPGSVLGVGYTLARRVLPLS